MSKIEKIKILWETLYSTINICYYSRFYTNINAYKTEQDSCIILGNGPSLKYHLDNHLDFLITENTLCVNQFVTSAYYEIIQPNFYLILDPNYWKVNPLTNIKRLQDEFINSINLKTKWQMVLFVSFKAERFFRHRSLIVNPNIKICYFNSTPINGFKKFRHFLYKKNLGMPFAQNVLVAGIFMALNLGFKEIFLLGADHSWHEDIYMDESNIVCHAENHFYPDNDVQLRPWYKNDGSVFKMHEISTAWAKMFEGYHYLEEYSKYLNKKIYNASKKSYIDAFERYDLDNR
jgi:hypothetical protein